MITELISVGTEILLGNIVNTNSAYLSEKCAQLGLSVYYQTVVGDNEARMRETIQTALDRSDVVILTGGLGPTEDDLTKEVTADVMGMKLVEDLHSKELMEEYLKKYKKNNPQRKITANNYKQAMVPVYERVFEIGPVFRAEKHNTQRHLNEYTSMDFEMGFIDGFEDIMQMETEVLQNIMAVLKKDYAPQLEMLHVKLPDVSSIPAVRFDEAKRMVSEKYGRPIRDPFDLEPEEEQLISRLFAEECGSEFVFVTHYPSKKRPFYAADDPEDPRYTLSFDLLFRGLEVTTGGQRIHDYDTQVKKLIKKGMNPEDFAGYLMIHQYGTCPHGGLGLGLERLTARLLGENNVRETCLFPRDQQRIEP